MSLSSHSILIMALLIWVGAALAGNMIAAPAKFQVDDLTRSVALQVGRAQFLWVGYLEYALAVIAGVATLTNRSSVTSVVVIAVLIFVVQRFVVLPRLSDATDLAIAGQAHEGSHLHLVFIGLEVVKVLTLLAASVMALLTPTHHIGRI